MPNELLCTTEEVIFLIMSLDPSKANGPDGISAQMLKGTAHSIAPSLTKLFNISISQGRFPECWKHLLLFPFLNLQIAVKLPTTEPFPYSQ